MAHPVPLPETQNIRPRTIVEVGHGDRPVWRYLKKLPLEGQSYVGLDLGVSKWPDEHAPLYDLDKGRREIQRRADSGKDCRFMTIRGDGILPLPSGTASEVYMSLVTNDPRLPNAVVERLLSEASRIMAWGAHLVIHNGTLVAMARGDVLVDFEDMSIRFKANFGCSPSPADSSNPISMFLNLAFRPMASGLYRQFFSERGYHPDASIEPGLAHSLLIKK